MTPATASRLIMSQEQEIRGLIELFVRAHNEKYGSRYEDPCWLDDLPTLAREQRVEVIYTDRSDSENRLAVEHTLLQPFHGEMYERQLLDSTLGYLEKHTCLIVPRFYIRLGVPVGVLRTLSSKRRRALGPVMEAWATQIVGALQYDPEHPQYYETRLRDFSLEVGLSVLSHPQYPGAFRVVGTYAPSSFHEMVEKALSDKLPKLMRAQAQKQILLLEKNLPMYTAWKLAKTIPVALGEVSGLEIWQADTSERERQGRVSFTRAWPDDGRSAYLVAEAGGFPPNTDALEY
jgi:hypothetical protein